jgi:putative methionine-R-sulfoxide reductase with GAF domain
MTHHAAVLLKNSPAQQRDPASRDRDSAARMRFAVDLMWEHLQGSGVSWIGFYVDQPQEPDDRRMVLGPCRDKPACSPIGLHGVCGQALRSKQTRIVRDVRDLGDMYIACDPRDRSEIVIPLPDESGECWAVFDVDSHEVNAFDESDDAGLRRVLAAAGLLNAAS